MSSTLPRSPLVLIALCCCMALIHWTSPTNAHRQLQNQKIFSLTPSSSEINKKSVELKPAGYHFSLSLHSMDCSKMKLDAAALENSLQKEQLSQQQQQQNIEKRIQHYKRIIASWDGRCLESKRGWWNYRLCFGMDARQFHGKEDDFSLGSRYRVVSHQELLFDEGDDCNPPAGTPDVVPKRLAKVNLMCGKSFALVDAEEPQICQYQMTVTHPDLCSSKGEPEIYKRYEKDSSSSTQSMGHSNRDSFLFAWEDGKVFPKRATSGGQLVLRRVNQQVKQSLDMCMKKIDILIDSVRASDILGIEVFEESLKPIAADDAVHVQEEGDSVRITSVEGFSGRLDLLRIFISSEGRS